MVTCCELVQPESVVHLDARRQHLHAVEHLQPAQHLALLALQTRRRELTTTQQHTNLKKQQHKNTTFLIFMTYLWGEND